MVMVVHVISWWLYNPYNAYQPSYILLHILSIPPICLSFQISHRLSIYPSHPPAVYLSNSPTSARLPRSFNLWFSDSTAHFKQIDSTKTGNLFMAFLSLFFKLTFSSSHDNLRYVTSFSTATAYLSRFLSLSIFLSFSQSLYYPLSFCLNSVSKEATDL